MKAAVLRGDTQCPGLVAVSVYDTKPVHFLSMACDSIKWVVKNRTVYDKATQGTKKIEFLRLNVNNDYNYGMGHVDLADQLWLAYKVNVWLWNYKWCHSILWWAIQVFIVNLYVVYKKISSTSRYDSSESL